MVKVIDPMARETFLRVNEPVSILPTHEVLEQCRAGLSRRIKNAKTHLEKNRLMDIRDEIDFLIDSL